MQSTSARPLEANPAESPSAEGALLGMLLRDQSVLSDLGDLLHDDCFSVHLHRQIYRAIRELSDRNTPVDIVSVADRLRADAGVDQSQTLMTLVTLLESAPISHSAEHYGQILTRDYVLRSAMNTCSTIVRQAARHTGSADAFLDFVESSFGELRRRQKCGEYHSIVEAIDSTLAQIEDAVSKGGGVNGVPTGFSSIDHLTGGLRPGHLVILAARPGMGKTALGLNMATGALLRGKKVFFASLEMTKEEIAARLLSAIGMVDGHRIKTGDLGDDELDRIMGATRRLSEYELNFAIDDSARLDLSALRRRVRRFKDENGLDLVMVDYLQLLKPAAGQRFESNALAVASISQGLKELAKELHVPVVALAQLNRDLEKRANQRPKASDLKDSGSIEADADLVLLIYRDDVANPDSAEKGFAELIVGKNRHGPMPVIRLAYHASFLRFTDVDR